MNLKGGVSDWIELINSRCMNIWDVLPSPRLMYRMHPVGDGNGLVGYGWSWAMWPYMWRFNPNLIRHLLIVVKMSP